MVFKRNQLESGSEEELGEPVPCVECATPVRRVAWRCPLEGCEALACSNCTALSGAERSNPRHVCVGRPPSPPTAPAKDLGEQVGEQVALYVVLVAFIALGTAAEHGWDEVDLAQTALVALAMQCIFLMFGDHSSARRERR